MMCAIPSLTAVAVVCLHACLLLGLQVLLENYLMLAAALENQNLGRMQDMLQWVAWHACCITALCSTGLQAGSSRASAVSFRDSVCLHQ
jgi:hypothetical protein